MTVGFSGVQANVSISGAVQVTGSTTPPTYPISGAYQKGTITANTMFTVFTPTAGRTAWITSLSVSNATAGNVQVCDNLGNSPLADSTSTANMLYFQCTTAGVMQYMTFPTPFKIGTAMKVQGNGTGAVTVNWVGYETVN